MRKRRLHSLGEEDMEIFKMKDAFNSLLKHLIYGDHDKMPGTSEYAMLSLETLGAAMSLCLPSSSYLTLTCLLCEQEPNPCRYTKKMCGLASACISISFYPEH